MVALRRGFLWLCLILSLAACQFGNVNVQRDENATTLTITMTEADVNALVQAALAASENPFLRNSSVDLRNGAVVIRGSHDRQDGQGTVNGSVAVKVSAAGGQPQIEITNVDIAGLAMSDDRLQQFNAQLAAQLGNRAVQDNRRAQISSIAITENSLEIVLTIPH